MMPQGESIGYLAAFLGGIAVSFSPCVYPLVPVTLSFLGLKKGNSHLRGLLHSLVYVLGMAIIYSALGLIASLTGKLFGQVAASPVSSLVVGNACIISGLSLFDTWNFNFMGVRLQNKIHKTGSYFAALLLGMASGLIAGPCTAPALGTILLIVAKKQNILYGATLLFVFAYGMGFLLILVGTFGGMFFNLAKSELWMARIKRLNGFILIAIGEYFIFEAGRLM
ncbi:MAG: cytochrome c biogenesis protein CcdA [Candidatus Omnitrophica bacterium]|nr:cytochrome c biogenesis protein CcdA [Candidatus Omnitrophota bacterium]